MKPIALSILCLVHVCIHAQQRPSLIVSAELNRTKGLSILYNRPAFKAKFAVGAGLEMVDVSRVGLGGFMPFADIRYNWRRGRSTVMPFVQGGYNIWNARSKMTTDEYKGGVSYGIGLGYSYAVNQRASGPYLGLKWRTIENQFRLNNAAPYQPMTERGLKIAVGWRF